MSSNGSSITIKEDNLGPIVKDTLYKPNYSINKYKVTYIIPNNTSCQNQNTPTTSTTSSREYLYDYNTTVKNINNSNNGIDIKCSRENKQFLGWDMNQNSGSAPEILVTDNITLYPIFVDKIPVSVYLFEKPFVQILYDSNFNLTSTNSALQTALKNEINKDNYKNNFYFNDYTESNPIKIYTNKECTDLFTNRTITEQLKLYIKAEPYITFKVIDGVSFKTNNNGYNQNHKTYIKEPLSKYSSSEYKTPIVTVSDPHQHFYKWKLVSENNNEFPYPLMLGEGSTELKNYKLNYPATYEVAVETNKYTVRFKDPEGNCSPPDTSFEVPANTYVTKDNYDKFNRITCTKAGHTFKGWEKESFTVGMNYCPAINLLFYILVIVLIAICVKYIINGFSNNKSRSSILHNRVMQ